jgi:hypothetical protein
MGFIEEYSTYIKNNPEGYWFKRKLYGWGWTPATWQGWVITLVFVALIVLVVYRFDPEGHSAKDVLTTFIPQVALLVLLLMLVCYKTGEKPKWQWGIPEKENFEEDVTRSSNNQ